MSINRIKIGSFLKMKRKEKDLSIKSLADHTISVATISKIERGVPSVNEDLLQIYCSKLGYTLQEVINIIERPSDENEPILPDLEVIENSIDSYPDLALKRLKDLKNDHPFANYVHYLTGKAYYCKQNWDKAIKHFIEAVRNSTNPQYKHLNIKSAALCELGRLYYQQNDLNSALEHTQEGIDSFVKDGERSYVFEALMLNKAVYLVLENAYRFEGVNDALDYLWEHIDELEVMEHKLLVYELKGRQLKAIKMYDQAIYYTKKGIQIARTNGLVDRRLELWTLLGEIYCECGKYEEAEKAFKAALDLQSNLVSKFLAVSPSTYLGRLYTRKKDWENAKEILHQAVEIGKDSPNKLKYLESLTVLGDYYLAQCQTDKANKYLEEALSIANQYGYVYNLREILVSLSQCWETVDERKFNQYKHELFLLEVRLKREA